MHPRMGLPGQPRISHRGLQCVTDSRMIQDHQRKSQNLSALRN